LPSPPFGRNYFTLAMAPFKHSPLKTIPAGLAMDVKITVCTLILAAVVVAVQWALRELAHSIDFSSFMAFCLVVVLVEVGLAFAWDRYGS
jgi:hypothetical protein